MIPYTSIFMVHWAMNLERSQMMRRSIESLIETTKHLPVEIIVVDNGGSTDDSRYLMSLCLKKQIHTYILNSEPMHSGFASNQAIASCKGEYIAFTCNDIGFYKGWLEACMRVFETYPKEKYYATPIDYPITNKYFKEYVPVLDKNYKAVLRAGSNVSLFRREDFMSFGRFKHHRISGVYWFEESIRQGFIGVVTPENMVEDWGFRKGHNFKNPIPIKRTLANGREIHFNEDEFKKYNKQLEYAKHL